MKNLLILFFMIAFGFGAHTQLEAFKNTKALNSFRLNKMEVNFVNFDELKQYRHKLSIGESGLEKLQIDEKFIFLYTLDGTFKLKEKPMKFDDFKVKITDQPNSKALIKEIKDSMDGIIELVNNN